MNDIERAKSLLINSKTLVFVKNDKVIDSELDGIKPLLFFLNEGKDLSGYSLADKIVGKAQAMLAVKANIKEVYAKVLSKDGKAILQKYHIPYSYGVLTDNIINRKGTDICPMEKVVQNIDDIEEAYEALKKAVANL